MRSFKEIWSDVLTVEEYNMLRNRIEKSLLLNLCKECGYQTENMVRRRWESKELQDRITAAIREQRVTIDILKKTLKEERKKYTENLDKLFALVRLTKGDSLL